MLEDSNIFFRLEVNYYYFFIVFMFVGEVVWNFEDVIGFFVGYDKDYL